MPKRSDLLLKRILDILVGISALLACSGLLLATAFLIRLNLGKPFVFRHLRSGKRGKKFVLIKFRTMGEAFDAYGYPVADAARLTPLGIALRKWSLDELPELWNVIKGEMSLVGPRPLLIRYLPRYSAEQARRHEVKPGITGWAQVNGRNAITWGQKFLLDVWYVDNLSFWLDLKIIAMTIFKIIKREGIAQPGQSTMEEFLGTAVEREEPKDISSGGEGWEARTD